MEKKEEIKKRILKFRDRLKEYQRACMKIRERDYGLNGGEDIFGEEEVKREWLTEEWGRLRGVFLSLNVPTQTMTPSIGYPTNIFEEALSALFDNPHKFESLIHAIQSATQAIGLIDSLTDMEFNKFSRKTPILFVAHSFLEKNEKLVNKVKEFLQAFPVSITTGAKPNIGSLSEKIKNLINDSDYVLIILTKDEEQKDKSWMPSKWICDEMAYALGGGKDIIRILEEGINYNPAISGDAEYINIKGENPAEAFIKLAHVLNSLLK